jgi:hypothetical protein
VDVTGECNCEQSKALLTRALLAEAERDSLARMATCCADAVKADRARLREAATIVIGACGTLGHAFDMGVPGAAQMRDLLREVALALLKEDDDGK